MTKKTAVKKLSKKALSNISGGVRPPGGGGGGCTSGVSTFCSTNQDCKRPESCQTYPLTLPNGTTVNQQCCGVAAE
ncbi:MAG: bacteriocin [Archangium sp.]|nr:bacteriocin [Archangium sp.]